MNKPIIFNKLLMLAVVGGLFLTQSGTAFAYEKDRGRSHDRRGHSDRSDRWDHGGRHDYDRHRHHGWHSDRSFFKIVIGTPSIGVIFTTLPFGHRTVIYGGVPYYYYNNIYYKRCHTGYVVVPPPVIVNAVPIAGSTVLINVPNSNGSYTQVTLIQQMDGYIGPQGEYYPNHPTIEQLRILYGK